MANWASTTYMIDGDLDTLKSINSVINDYISGRAKPTSGASNGWHGDVLKALGIDTKKCNHIRGFFQEAYIIDDALRIESEEAWSRTEFAELLSEKYDELSIYWITEECGNEIYETNDADGVHFTERFFVEVSINGDYQCDYFDSEMEAYEWVERISGCKNDDEIKRFNEEHNEDGDYINVHEYEIV